MPAGPGSVRVFDEHVIGTALTPLEGESPLVIDSHMPGTVVFLQVVAWRGLHEIHRWRRVELSQLPLGHALDVDEPATLARGEQALRVGAGERLDRHGGKNNCYPVNSQFGDVAAHSQARNDVARLAVLSGMPRT